MFQFAPTGIHTSIAISESALGLDTAVRRQNAGNVENACACAGFTPEFSGSVNAPLPTSATDLIVTCGKDSAASDWHGAAQLVAGTAARQDSRSVTSLSRTISSWHRQPRREHRLHGTCLDGRIIEIALRAARVERRRVPFVEWKPLGESEHEVGIRQEQFPVDNVVRALLRKDRVARVLREPTARRKRSFEQWTQHGEVVRLGQRLQHMQ